MNWQLYPVPNKTIVRSIAFGTDGKLYAGAQNEFGYYSSDASGRLVYTSLKKLLPPSIRSFADIWNIEIINQEVFFMATDIIIHYANNKLNYYKSASSWLSLKKHNGKIIAQESNKGIRFFNRGRWETLINQTALPSGFLITDTKPFSKDTSLVSTAGHGLYLLSQNSIHPFKLNTFYSEKFLTSIDVLDPNYFLVGSYNTGLYKIDRHGNIYDNISASNGLISNTIRCIFTGTDGYTWIGLDNSLALVDWNISIRHINPSSFNNGSGQGAAILNGDLYFALSTGLQWIPFKKDSDLGKASLEPATILKGLTWNLSVWNNQLIVGRDDGLWTVKNHQATPIAANTGFWNFHPLHGTAPLKILCGNYLGIQILGEEGDKLKNLGVFKHFIESSRYLEIDNNYIWVSHPYRGLYRINLADSSIKKYTSRDGLPTDLDNHVFKLNGNIVFGTKKGIYEPDRSGARIVPSSYFQKTLGDRPIRYLKEDLSGNIWFVQDKMLGVLELAQTKPTVKFIPELFNHVLSGFENIYPYDADNVLIGSEIGFYTINYKKYREKTLSYQTYITSVKVKGSHDSIFYGGYPLLMNEQASKVSIPYKMNSIHFSFATSFIRYKSGTEFSYFLEGYDKNWSNWGPQHEKEYTNLPEGKYTFHVKSRYGPSFEFKTYTYAFKIDAPWYRTVWAYLLYFIGFILLIILLLKLQKKRLQKKEALRMLAEKNKFEEEQRQISFKYQLKLEKKEKALIKLKNENLEAELQHKSTELASATMNLLQKKEFLKKIGDELTKVYLPIKDHVDASEIKKILRHLNSEGKLDDEWKQFSIHFNNVHSNFLITLKEVFPDLNAHEMKLCAYLRMNLSSKEIAQLLSISVRGVEISRYRLRKKLKLQPNEDLFEFLFNMKPDDHSKIDQTKDTP